MLLTTIHGCSHRMEERVVQSAANLYGISCEVDQNLARVDLGFDRRGAAAQLGARIYFRYRAVKTYPRTYVSTDSDPQIF